MTKLVIGLRPQSQQGNNPKDRVGAKKIDLTLIPPTTSVFLAMGLAVGARKYGPFNWRVEPIKARGYLAAAKRHIDACLDGEDFDPIEGVHHLGFALSTTAIYLDAMVHGTLIDDRPVPGRTGELISRISEAYADGNDPEELQQKIVDLVNSSRNDKFDLVVTRRKGRASR